jgi:Arylsulfotransferase (ASST)
MRRVLVVAAVLLAIAAAYWSRSLTRREEVPAAGPAKARALDPSARPRNQIWQKMRERKKAPLAERQQISEEVASLPYLQAYQPASGDEGVTRHDETAAFAGVNLYNSGDAAEACLIDMKGRPLHRWRMPFAEAFPEVQLAPKKKVLAGFWRRVHLLPDGSLIAIYEQLGILRLDAQSRIQWRREGRFHHDLAVNGDGRIFVLDAKTGRLPRINAAEDVIEDVVTVLDPEGRVLESFSLLEAFERSDYAPLLQSMEPRGDLFHTNTLKILDGTLSDRLPAFRKGNLLISLRELDTVAVVNPRDKRVEWALSGLWQAQHEPVLLANGRLLVFDNLGRGGESRVVELDPLTQKIEWQYGGTPDEPFASWKLGAAQRLPNGNTLITESTAGRAFEVTPAGRIVWEFLNPARAGRDRQLIAALNELRRFGPELLASHWLNGGQVARR